MGDGIIALSASGMFIGVAATFTMDMLGTFARKSSLTVGVKAQWVGRWYIGIARGQFFHSNINASSAQPGEKRVALIGHYIIGIVLAILYLACADWLAVSPVGLLYAVGFGIATCVFPWFLMYPAIGFGTFGLKGPKELKLVTTSFFNHFFYGFGLWWATVALHAASG